MMAVAQVQGAACAAPPKPVTANEAKAKAVTSDFSIFVSPEFACLHLPRATRCAASLRASLLADSRVKDQMRGHVALSEGAHYVITTRGCKMTGRAGGS